MSSKSCPVTSTSTELPALPPHRKIVNNFATGSCAWPLSRGQSRRKSASAMGEVLKTLLRRSCNSVGTLMIKQKFLGINQVPDDVFVSLPFCCELLLFRLAF